MINVDGKIGKQIKVILPCSFGDKLHILFLKHGQIVFRSVLSRQEAEAWGLELLFGAHSCPSCPGDPIRDEMLRQRDAIDRSKFKEEIDELREYYDSLLSMVKEDKS